MSLANGHVGLALEGGYSASATADCVSACVNALLLQNPPCLDATSATPRRVAQLEDSLVSAATWVPRGELLRAPRPEAVQTLQEVAAAHAQSGRWRCLAAASENTADFALYVSEFFACSSSHPPIDCSPL